MVENQNSTLNIFQEFSKIRKKPLYIYSGAIGEITEECFLNFLINTYLPNNQNDSLDIILNTYGGCPHSGYKVAMLLLKYVKDFSVFVPYKAKSAGTLMSLSADRITLSALGELGPLDTQVLDFEKGVPNFQSTLDSFAALDEIRKHHIDVINHFRIQLLGEKTNLKPAEIISLAIDFAEASSSKLYQKVDLKAIGSHSRAMKISIDYGTRILDSRMNKKRIGMNINTSQQVDEVVNSLVLGFPDHASIIGVQELNNIKLPLYKPNDLEMSLLNTMNPLMSSLLKGGKTISESFSFEIEEVLNEKLS